MSNTDDPSKILRDNEALNEVEGKTIENVAKAYESVVIEFEDGSSFKIDTISANGILPVWDEDGEI